MAAVWLIYSWLEKLKSEFVFSIIESLEHLINLSVVKDLTSERSLDWLWDDWWILDFY